MLSKNALKHGELSCLQEGNAYVEITHHTLDMTLVVNKVRKPQAGAIVLFAGMQHLKSISSISLNLIDHYRNNARQLRWEAGKGTTILCICSSRSEKHAIYMSLRKGKVWPNWNFHGPSVRCCAHR